MGGQQAMLWLFLSCMLVVVSQLIASKIDHTTEVINQNLGWNKTIVGCLVRIMGCHIGGLTAQVFINIANEDPLFGFDFLSLGFTALITGLGKLVFPKLF